MFEFFLLFSWSRRLLFFVWCTPCTIEEELARDYDMKKVQKMEKLKDDLLKGKRKGKRKQQAQKALESMGISLTTTTSASSQTLVLRVM